MNQHPTPIRITPSTPTMSVNSPVTSVELELLSSWDLTSPYAGRVRACARCNSAATVGAVVAAVFSVTVTRIYRVLP